MARKLRVTVRRLQGYFRERFDLAPHEWMVGVRMTRASDLLIAGRPAKVVPVRVGYKQLSHFSREFKRYFGMAPREYVEVRATKVRILPHISRLDKKVRI